jgi:hypothetical protein
MQEGKGLDFIWICFCGFCVTCHSTVRNLGLGDFVPFALWASDLFCGENNVEATNLEACLSGCGGLPGRVLFNKDQTRPRPTETPTGDEKEIWRCRSKGMERG